MGEKRRKFDIKRGREKMKINNARYVRVQNFMTNIKQQQTR